MNAFVFTGLNAQTLQVDGYGWMYRLVVPLGMEISESTSSKKHRTAVPITGLFEKLYFTDSHHKLQVFGAGRIHHMKRVAKITKETFEDIMKRVEDRRKESRNRNEFLMNELGQAKIRGEKLKEKLKRQSDTLKRLKRELEHSKTQLRY